MTKILLENGIDLDVRTKHGFTPLNMATEKGEFDWLMIFFLFDFTLSCMAYLSTIATCFDYHFLILMNSQFRKSENC